MLTFGSWSPPVIVHLALGPVFGPDWNFPTLSSPPSLKSVMADTAISLRFILAVMEAVIHPRIGFISSGRRYRAGCKAGCGVGGAEECCAFRDPSNVGGAIWYVSMNVLGS